MSKMCPNCEKEMIEVKFAYDKKTGKRIPNVSPRLMCLDCGYQETDSFPKRTTVYLHSNKDSMWDKGRELGLSDKAISDNFSSCLYEVAFDIEVYEDGTYKIIGGIKE